MNSTTATLPRTRSGRGIFVPFVVFCGLLLAALSADIYLLMPPQSPEQRQHWLPMRERIKNFFIAQKLAERLITEPPTRWSGPLKCGEIGNGLWYAEGLVGQESTLGTEIATPWKVIFDPKTGQYFYMVVGTKEEGDFPLALRLAGIKPKTP